MMENFTLSNGVSIPAVGYGTYLADCDSAAVVENALRAGYRHFDTASFYGNEAELGRALQQCGAARGMLFLTSKLWKTELGYRQALDAFERSLEKLGTDYLDLYLITGRVRTTSPRSGPSLTAALGAPWRSYTMRAAFARSA